MRPPEIGPAPHRCTCLAAAIASAARSMEWNSTVALSRRARIPWYRPSSSGSSSVAPECHAGSGRVCGADRSGVDGVDEPVAQVRDDPLQLVAERRETTEAELAESAEERGRTDPRRRGELAGAHGRRIARVLQYVTHQSLLRLAQVRIGRRHFLQHRRKLFRLGEEFVNSVGSTKGTGRQPRAPPPETGD